MIRSNLLTQRLPAILSLLGTFAVAIPVLADPPAVAYLFPAGGQLGTTVNVRVGGLNLFDKPFFTVEGSGVTTPARLQRMPTIWFEGPHAKLPASQQKEDYAQDYAAAFEIAADASLGPRICRARTAQGISPPVMFVVGTLPEVVEEEYFGEPIPTPVQLPITINGRIFPREDIDLWEFSAEANRPLQIILTANEIGSPLEGMLEVLDPAGQVVAEATSRLKQDPQLRFIPTMTGRHTVRVRDVRSDGLQHYVYRLTITAGPWLESCFPLGGKAGTTVKVTPQGLGLTATTLEATLPPNVGIQRHAFADQGKLLNPLWFEVDNLDEVFEANNAGQLAIPVVANGQILNPGEADLWTFTAKKGERLKFEIRAARLNSPLDAVLVIRDANGKELARGDDLPNNSPDCEIAFSPAADGTFTAEVRDRFASRGGPAFGYRLKVTNQRPQVDVTWEVDSLAIDVGGTQKIPLKLQRSGGFAGPVTISAMGLPPGVTAEPLVINAKQAQGTLTFTCAENIAVATQSFRIIAAGEHDGEPIEATACRNDPDGRNSPSEIPLAITLKTPFSYKGEYDMRFIPRGMELRKTYQIDWGGYTGPLVMQLAERQGRHLQGVSGPQLTIPPEATEFEYPIMLAPDMELGRTSRVNVMLLGELTDAAGERHQISYSNNNPNEQLISIVSPAPLRLSVENNPVGVTPGTDVKLHVVIKRDPSLHEAIQLELIPAAHQRGIAAMRLEVPADRDEFELTVPLAADAGPFNSPWILRGKTYRNQELVIAQTVVKQIVATDTK